MFSAIRIVAVFTNADIPLTASFTYTRAKKPIFILLKYIVCYSKYLGLIFNLFSVSVLTTMSFHVTPNGSIVKTVEMLKIIPLHKF